MKKLLVLITMAAVVLGVVAAMAGASTGNTMLCYSKYQVEPGVWSDAPAGGGSSSAQLLAAGYWLPYAEKTVPTNATLPNGWYLDCNPPAALIASAAGVTLPVVQLVGGAGELITDPTLVAQRKGGIDYYPVAPGSVK